MLYINKLFWNYLYYKSIILLKKDMKNIVRMVIYSMSVFKPVSQLWLGPSQFKFNSLSGLRRRVNLCQFQVGGRQINLCQFKFKPLGIIYPVIFYRWKGMLFQMFFELMLTFQFSTGFINNWGQFKALQCKNYK